jgi:N-acyl-D-amino-acid deacylase
LHDLVIRAGTIVDGTGSAPFTGDVAIRDGKIAAVGRDVGAAKRTIDADGLTVTPGWVDVHTHYDGQVSWDPLLAPSVWHGVSTVVMGNCGVGFAPAAPERREWLISLMEGVEDIPGPALHAGMPWNWESFPQYLDALSQMPRTLDVGGQIAHGAVRAYVMGERGAANEPAAEDDAKQMAELVAEAIRAGAFGFSTSRTIVHTGTDGCVVPGTYASEEELATIARGIRSTGRGLMEGVFSGVVGEHPDDMGVLVRETQMFRRIAKATGCPVTFLLAQHNGEPHQWREQLAECEAAAKEGVPLRPQVFARPVNVLFSFQGENPFQYLPSYAPLKNASLAERVAMLRDPGLRARLLSEKDPNTTGVSLIYKNDWIWQRTYPLGAPLNYTPKAEHSIAALAEREGRRPLEVVYDLLLRNEGKTFLMFAVAGYSEGNPDALHAMLKHPLTSLGGSDAGAHLRQIVDASVHTYMLTHWVRDEAPGSPYHLPIEAVVKKLTLAGARLYGMSDRGALAPGMKADVNLIDLPNLALDLPEMIHDMPAGMPRLMQTAKGYVATLVAGETVQENGVETGARPGKIVRSGMAA